MKTVNITLKIEPEHVNGFERYLRQELEVIDFKILSDTKKLYETDPVFQKLVKAQKSARKVCDDYINLKNFN